MAIRIMANRTGMMSKSKKKKRRRRRKSGLLIDVAIQADRIVTQKEAEKKIIQEFMYRHTTNVEHEM